MWLLTSVQGLPLPAVLLFLASLGLGISAPIISAALGLNLGLVLIRFALLFAIAPSYDRTQSLPRASWLFWLSPFADPLAVLRIFLSASQRPKTWRGRSYKI